MNYDKDAIQVKIDSDYPEDTRDLKQILINAIKMQALYSESRIRMVEISKMVN